MANELKDIWGGLAGGVAGGLGALFGGFGARRAANRQIKATKGLMSNIDLWRDQHANMDGTESAAFQRIISENSRRMGSAARAAAGRKAVTGVDEAPEIKQANAAQAGSLLADAAIAKEARNNSIDDQAFSKKVALQEKINEIEAGKPGALDMLNGVVGGTAAGIENGIGIQNHLKQV